MAILKHMPSLHTRLKMMYVCGAGCPAGTAMLTTGDLLCPRWCITYKRGKSNGRQGCFGRMGLDEVQPTVVGRAEPHNLRLVHPYQDRVVTIRENARCQVPPP
jgi:DNA (cytosine-5)-methyltransferase 1